MPRWRDKFPQSFWDPSRRRRWWVFFFLGVTTFAGLVVSGSFVIAYLNRPVTSKPLGPGPAAPPTGAPPIVPPHGPPAGPPSNSSNLTFRVPLETAQAQYGAYFVSILVGTGSTIRIDTLLDTGSPDTWFDQSAGFVSGSLTYRPKSGSYSAAYMGGTVNGLIGSDVLKFGSYSWSQTFGVVSSNNLGLGGLMGLSRGGCTAQQLCAIGEWNLGQNVLAFYYDTHTWEGYFMGGYIAPNTYCAPGSSITYTPQVGHFYWQSTVSLYYNNVLLGSNIRAAFDTGSTYVIMNTVISNQVQLLSSATGGCTAPTMTAVINGVSFVIPPNVLVAPGSSSSNCRLRVSSFSGGGYPFDIILGATFLINFYTVFDLTNERIGFCYSQPGLAASRRLEEGSDRLAKLLDHPERNRRIT